MTACSSEFLSRVSAVVGPENLTLDQPGLTSGSRDCFHFSPVLIPQLEGRTAEAIAFPRTQEQLRELIALSVRQEVAVTPRGGGTGNYGQGVPLHGGLMINTRRMDRILRLDSAEAHVEAGVRLWSIEQEAARHGAELRMFPSTVVTSSAAGFITGGSGGIGSVQWGMLRDLDNIRQATILTCEANPRRLELRTADELADVLHNCGLTAFATEVVFALAPKTQWHQYVLAFDDFQEALACAQEVATDRALGKRLATVFEWPVPSYFVPLVRRGACPEGKALAFLMTPLPPQQMADHLSRLGVDGGECTFHLEPNAKPAARKGFQIYDFTWNHTTQWAMKSDPKLTYLQENFDPDRVATQLRERRQRFGDQVQSHIEFIYDPDAGVVRPGGLSIVKFRGKRDLWRLIDYCEAHGIQIANPHTHYLDDDTRWYGDNFLAAKDRWDPNHLLNPGHLRALE
ncbi:MAG: FAD-binding oxidoreductase [Gammaproteobacteria bacterium]|nr:FAD-binding oxidoreductase [Gammaproteobacteria bacterium]